MDLYNGITMKYTYQETYERVGRLATSLEKKFNLRKGDRVMIFTTNLYESIVFAQACARLGCVHYLLNATTSVAELASQLESFNPHLIFTMSHIPLTEQTSSNELKWAPTKEIIGQAFSKIRPESDFSPNSVKIIYTLSV